MYDTVSYNIRVVHIKAYVMYSSFTSSKESFIFTRTAAGAILGGVCQRLEVWANCVWAIVKVGTKMLVRFISKKKFLEYFVQSRKERSFGIPITHVAGTHYQAVSSQGDRLYNLLVFRTEIQCDCEDYKNQFSLFGNKPKCCKHGYALLNRLGYGSLRQWIDNNYPF